MSVEHFCTDLLINKCQLNTFIQTCWQTNVSWTLLYRLVDKQMSAEHFCTDLLTNKCQLNTCIDLLTNKCHLNIFVQTCWPIRDHWTFLYILFYQQMSVKHFCTGLLINKYELNVFIQTCWPTNVRWTLLNRCINQQICWPTNVSEGFCSWEWFQWLYAWHHVATHLPTITVN